MTATVSLFQKSTIVRSLKLPLPVRALSAGLAALSPELAAAWTEQVFLTVPSFRAPRRERQWIDSADPVEIGANAFEAVGGTLAGRRRPLSGLSWGSGPTVLLSHGWGGRAAQMGALGVGLAAAGFRALAFDAPGHGGSGGLQSSLPAMAETLLAAEHRFGPFAGYVAHSLGVAAVTMAARRGLADRPAVLIAAPADLEFFLGDVAAAVGVPIEVAQIMRRRVERRFSIRWSELRPAGLVRWIGDSPLLVVSDANDSEVPCSHGAAIAAERPAARFERTVGLGHRRILRDPGVVARSVDFLSASVRSQAYRSTRQPALPLAL